jgi:alpha-tubulin suppressor-like RCC1 family protein
MEGSGGHGSGSHADSSPRPQALELHGRAVRVDLFGHGLNAPRAESVCGGYNFCAVVTTVGDLFTFGLNDRFQCGHGDR